MFRAVLRAQWKWSRLIVTLGAVAGCALPILSLQGAARPGRNPLSTQELLTAVQSWGVAYPLLAGALGLLLATATWAPDHRGRHIHALTLPVPRWRFALLRFAAGAAFLGIPALAVLLGAVAATATATLPPGLQGYAWSLGFRFALALLLAYSVFFAISAGTPRTAGAVLGIVAAILLTHVIVGMTGTDTNVLGTIQQLVLSWPGPIAVFAGRWMLVDV